MTTKIKANDNGGTKKSDCKKPRPKTSAKTDTRADGPGQSRCPCVPRSNIKRQLSGRNWNYKGSNRSQTPTVVAGVGKA